MYYPKDWRADAVFGCSLAARGLWHEMMNMMHASERYGYLCNNGAAIPDEAISRYCGCSLQEYQTLLPELERAGVPRRTPNGIIFCKRMVDDQKERQVWRKQKKNQRDARSPSDVHPNVRRMSARLPFPPPLPITNIKAEEAAAAFSALGYDQPFGQKPFKEIWTRRYREKSGEWLTEAMEGTIQECQQRIIGVPPQFYKCKHEIEKYEEALFMSQRKAPL
jgi:hypothetical protein